MEGVPILLKKKKQLASSALEEIKSKIKLASLIYFFFRESNIFSLMEIMPNILANSRSKYPDSGPLLRTYYQAEFFLSDYLMWPFDCLLLLQMT